MGAKWTKEQQRVIDLRDENLLVSAAAGSGKTAVLVERIVSRITDRKSPADVDSLLVVTFTEAAAAEMKERIGAAIEKRLEENPQDENLIRQAALVYTAPITTIHSFCLSVIREHFHVIGLDPAFRVGEEGELTLLKQDVIDALLEEQYSSEDAAFLSFAEKYGTGRTDQKIEELILKLYEYSRSYPWPEDWLNSCLSLYRADTAHPERLEEMALAKEAVSVAQSRLKDIRKISARALAICRRPAGPAGYEAAIQSDLELIDDALRADGYRELQSILGNISWKRLGRCSKDTDPDLCEAVKELRDRVKKAAKALADAYFYAPIEVWAADLAVCLPDMETLIGLVHTFAESYAGEKRRRNLIDFDDMEHMALQILTESEAAAGAADAGISAASAAGVAEAAGNLTSGTGSTALYADNAASDRAAGAFGSSARAVRPSAVAREYRERFTEVMVDEYQDSSLVQEMILQMVSGVPDGRNNRFMVGDVKQSIYRFRLSRPELFMEKYNTYRADTDGELPAASSAEQNAAERDAAGQQTAGLPSAPSGQNPAEEGVRIDLHKNFRSRPEVLDSVNHVFRRIMRRELGGIAYDDRAALYPGAVFPPLPKEHSVQAAADSTAMPGTVKGDSFNETAGTVNSEAGADAGTVNPAAADAGMDAAGPAAGAWKAGSPYRTEFLLYDKSSQDTLDAKEAEARVIAQRMKELRQSALVTDRQTGGYRRVQYRDMVVLLRSAKGWTDVFQSVFEEEGIPAYSVSREGYFAAYEVSLLLDYLKLLDNARQDHPLAAVLASPLVGLTDREMAEIRAACPEGPFYEAVRKYAGIDETTEKPRDMSGQPAQMQAECKAASGQAAEEGCRDGTAKETAEDHKDLARRLADFFAQLADFRARSHYTAIHELLQQLIAETGYDLIISAMPGGAQRLANVEMLLQKAAAFEETSYKGLFNFVRYIEQLKKYDVDYGEAGMLDDQADAVRLMSIHKSKGLEFPIVFAAGMGKNFNMTDSRSSAALDSDLGAGIDLIDLDSRTKTPIFLKRVIQQKIKRENLAEEMRVLYVAMTRAKEKLILSGSVKLDGAGPGKYSRPMDENGMLDLLSLESASGFLDWVLPAVLDPPRSNENFPGNTVDIRLFTEADLLAQAAVDARAEAISQQELENWNPDAAYIPGAAARLDAQMNFVYSYADEEAMKLKFTVSELKKRAGVASDDENGAELYEEPVVIPLIPRFQMAEEQAEGGLTGAGRGTAYHAFMEMLDLQASYDAQSLQEALRQFKKEGRLSAEMAACIRVKDILCFLQNRAARRMAEAERKGRLYREQPFVLGVDAAQIYPEIYAAGTAAAEEPGVRKESAAAAGRVGEAGKAAGTAEEPGVRKESAAAAGTADESGARQESAAAAGTAEEHGMRQEESQAAGTRHKTGAAEAYSGRETILVQGIIDVWFEEDDGLVVLDYKTDHVSRPQELIDRYRAQLDYYAQALEQLLEKPVKEKIIYSFCLGKEILL